MVTLLIFLYIATPHFYVYHHNTDLSRYSRLYSTTGVTYNKLKNSNEIWTYSFSYSPTDKTEYILLCTGSIHLVPNISLILSYIQWLCVCVCVCVCVNTCASRSGVFLHDPLLQIILHIHAILMKIACYTWNAGTTLTGPLGSSSSHTCWEQHDFSTIRHHHYSWEKVLPQESSLFSKKYLVNTVVSIYAFPNSDIFNVL